MKAVVIGAGIIGVTTAYELHGRGFEVCVVDQEAGVAMGATDANGGLLTPSMSDPWNAPGVWKDLLRWLGREDAPMLLRLRAFPGIVPWGIRFLLASKPELVDRASRLNAELGRYSLQLLSSLQQEQGFQFGRRTVGTMKIYRNPDSLAAGIAKSAKIADLGIRAVPLDADGAVALEPALCPIKSQLAGAIHFPDDQSGHAPVFARELASHAAASGVNFSLSTRVRDILVDGGRVTGVRHDKGEERADIVVVASGHMLPGLARQVGASVPLSPVKGYSITVPVERAACNTADPLPQVPMLDDDLHAAITPLGDMLRIAGTAEFVGLDRRIASGRIDNLCSLTRQLLPRHADRLLTGDLGARTGFRPMCADGLPVFGEAKVRGCYVSGGHGALGWTQSLGTARLLAQMVAGEATDLSVDAFSPQRFGR